MDKDVSIIRFLARLEADLGAGRYIVIEQNVEADLCAIQLYSQQARKGLVHVSTRGGSLDRYDVDLEEMSERDADGSLMYPEEVRLRDIDYSTALAYIREHLNLDLNR